MGIRLTERDEAIIEHIGRYRITTIEVLYRLFFEPTASKNAVSQVLLRLVGGGYLKRSETPVLGSENYYQLTARTALEHGEEEHFASPPGAMSLVFHYAMLEFCCLGAEPREHITAREIRAGFPSFNGRGIARHGYFHTHDDPVRIGWLEVDCGNRAETRARKCLKQFQKRYIAADLAFADLADAGRFGLVLVVPSAGKQQAFERVFSKLPSFPLAMVVSPRLGELLGQTPHHGSRPAESSADVDCEEVTRDADDEAGAVSEIAPGGGALS